MTARLRAVRAGVTLPDHLPVWVTTERDLEAATVIGGKCAQQRAADAYRERCQNRADEWWDRFGPFVPASVDRR